MKLLPKLMLAMSGAFLGLSIFGYIEPQKYHVIIMWFLITFIHAEKVLEE